MILNWLSHIGFLADLEQINQKNSPRAAGGTLWVEPRVSLFLSRQQLLSPGPVFCPPPRHRSLACSQSCHPFPAASGEETLGALEQEKDRYFYGLKGKESLAKENIHSICVTSSLEEIIKREYAVSPKTARSLTNSPISLLTWDEDKIGIVASTGCGVLSLWSKSYNKLLPLFELLRPSIYEELIIFMYCNIHKAGRQTH